jgi:hypothetical protein
MTRHTPEQLRGLLAHALAHPPTEQPTVVPRSLPEWQSDDEPPPRDEPEFAEPEYAVRNHSSNLVDDNSRRVQRAERDALRLAITRPTDVVGWIDECLFSDPLHREAFVALAPGDDLHLTIQNAPIEVGSLIRRLSSVGPTDILDPEGIFIELVRNATTQAVIESEADARRAALAGNLDGVTAAGARNRWLKEEIELLRDPVQVPGRSSAAVEAAHRLLAWLIEAHREG